ncbi:MAG: PAS domain S-box protein [Desulfobacteraceae bacterium]|nr:PAS domain S-box protein [Desulfobacteraceae bacterium]
MTIFSKILLAVLLLMTISLLGLSFISYHITRESLWRVSHELIHLKLEDAINISSENLEVLRRFGLDWIPANVKKAQDESARDLNDIHFGKSGHVFVVDDRGIVLAHPNPKLIGHRIAGRAWYVNSKNNKIDHIEFTWPDEARIGCISRFEAWHWNVVCSQSRAEILGPVNRIRAITLWATLGILILTSIILRFVIHGIVSPISKLTRASAALARGEEVEELKAGSSDEIGILTATFIQMRDAIREQFAKIRESEEKHRRLVENLGREYFFYAHGTDGVFSYVSPSLTEMLGYDQAEFKTHYCTYLTDNPINHDARIKTEECIKGIKPPPYQIEIRHKSGGLRRLEITEAPILDPEGRVTAVEGIAHDVTDKMRMEEMMIQSEKMLSVGGLAAGMAHEINNPLAGMMQTAWVMANRLDAQMHLPASIKAAQEAGTSVEAIRNFMEARGILRMITNIIESGRRVAEIVDNMLSFARKSDASLAPHDMADLLDKTLELATTDYDLKKHYDFKKIEIRKEYEDNLPPVPCEGAKIQQVLLNILRNGAQAMQESGALPHLFIVRAYVKPERKMMCLEIKDNGPGMTEATRKRVFEPFYTTKTVGQGTGLGLSVSYFIITENHGGEMTVESRPGAGTKFIIHLPLERRQV